MSGDDGDDDDTLFWPSSIGTDFSKLPKQSWQSYVPDQRKPIPSTRPPVVKFDDTNVAETISDISDRVTEEIENTESSGDDDDEEDIGEMCFTDELERLEHGIDVIDDQMSKERDSADEIEEEIKELQDQLAEKRERYEHLVASRAKAENAIRLIQSKCSVAGTKRRPEDLEDVKIEGYEEKRKKLDTKIRTITRVAAVIRERISYLRKHRIPIRQPKQSAQLREKAGVFKRDILWNQRHRQFPKFEKPDWLKHRSRDPVVFRNYRDKLERIISTAENEYNDMLRKKDPLLN